MIDGKRELAFELQNSGVYEKRSESLKLFQGHHRCIFKRLKGPIEDK